MGKVRAVDFKQGDIFDDDGIKYTVESVNESSTDPHAVVITVSNGQTLTYFKSDMFETVKSQLTSFQEVKDSGARQSFETGSVRDTRDGKGRFDLISPIALKRLAQHYENGSKKYGDRNWEKGQPVSRYLDSAIRHLQTYLLGARDEDHLSAAAWNVFAMIHTIEMCKIGKLPAELDDLPEGWMNV